MIDLDQVTFAYPKSSCETLRNLHLRVGAGSISGLFGPNGSGKSTLLKVIAGLLFPQGGNCSVLDRVPSGRCPEFLSNIILLPEDVFVPNLSADSYINQFAPFYPKFDIGVMEKLLREFNLQAHSKLTELSLGQKKKFLLSFSIATNARLLLLDEPSNGLDIPSKVQLRNVLLDHYDENRTYIISTHQAHDLEGLIDSVIFLMDGKILLNRSLDFIGTKIRCGREYEQPNDVLYCEPTMDGYAVVDRNSTGEESNINLELLFNFVVTSAPQVNSLLGESVI